MNTIVVTIGDIRGTGPNAGERIDRLTIEWALDQVDNLLASTYTRMYSPTAGKWQGEPEGTAVIIGMMNNGRMPALREVVLPRLARSLDQEAIGLIVQNDTHTLVTA